MTEYVSRLVSFADSVTDAINAFGGLPKGLVAVTDLNPQARLDDLVSPFLAVTPGERDSSPDSRSVFKSTQSVTVYLVAPCRDELLGWWLGVADRVYSAILANDVPHASLTQASLSPLDESAWLEDGLFVGVIQGTWTTHDIRHG